MLTGLPSTFGSQRSVCAFWPVSHWPSESEYDSVSSFATSRAFNFRLVIGSCVTWLST